LIRLAAWTVAGFFWCALFLVVGLYVTFPQAPLKERVEHESVRFSDKQFAVQMEQIRPWWLGVMGSDVTVYGLKKGRRTKDNPKPGYERSEIMTLDALGVRAEPLSFVLGQRAAAFTAELLGGAVSGRYGQGEAAVDLSFSAEGLELARLAAGSAEEALHLLGTLEGEADLHFDTSDVKQSTGTVRLEVQGLGIGAGSKAGGFGLPEALFEKAVLSGEVSDGKLEIIEGVFEGSVISAVVTGDISLNKRVSRSRNRLDLGFTLPDEYDQLAQLLPTLKRSKDEEGRYHCSISGTVLNPTFRCGSKSTTSRPRLGGADGPVSERIGSAGGDEDDRKKAREQRIAERRERLKKQREAAAEGRDEERPKDLFDLPEEDMPPPGEPPFFDEPPMDRMGRDPLEDGPPWEELPHDD